MEFCGEGYERFRQGCALFGGSANQVMVFLIAMNSDEHGLIAPRISSRNMTFVMLVSNGNRPTPAKHRKIEEFSMGTRSALCGREQRTHATPVTGPPPRDLT